MERVTFTTSDNVTIVGDYYPGNSLRGALLLHMMPSDRTSWSSFATKLADRGYHVLAIDLRGHGESEGGPAGYKDFSDEDHQQSIMDVDAAAAFLSEKGIALDQLTLVGASIGANLALWYAAERHDIPVLVLLSAGFNYKGIKAEEYVAGLGSNQRVFFASSEDDEGNAEMNQQLSDQALHRTRAQYIKYQEAGHGTDMFSKEEPDLAREILSWIEQ